PEDPPLRDAVRAALAEDRLDVFEKLRMLVEQPRRSGRAAALLVRDRQPDDLPAAVENAPLEIDQGRQLSDAEALVVEGAAPPEPAVPHESAERRHRPAGTGGHDVDVVEQEDRPGGGRARARRRQARPEARPAGLAKRRCSMPRRVKSPSRAPAARASLPGGFEVSILR